MTAIAANSARLMVCRSGLDRISIRVVTPEEGSHRGDSYSSQLHNKVAFLFLTEGEDVPGQDQDDSSSALIL